MSLPRTRVGDRPELESECAHKGRELAAEIKEEK